MKAFVASISALETQPVTTYALRNWHREVPKVGSSIRAAISCVRCSAEHEITLHSIRTHKLGRRSFQCSAVGRTCITRLPSLAPAISMDHMSDQNREFVDMDTPAEGRADDPQSPISMAQEEPPQTPEEVTADNPRPSHLMDMDSPLSQGMYGPRYAYLEDPNRIQVPSQRNDSRTNNSANRNWRPRLTVNNEPKPILPGPPIYYPGIPWAPTVRAVNLPPWEPQPNTASTGHMLPLS